MLVDVCQTASIVSAQLCKAAGGDRTARESPIRRCVYSEPQIASVGLTEPQARATAREVRVGRYLFRNNGKAIAAGDTDGFIKVLFDADSDRLLRAHLIGPEVTELVQGFVIAMTLGATGVDLIDCASLTPLCPRSCMRRSSPLMAYRCTCRAPRCRTQGDRRPRR